MSLDGAKREITRLRRKLSEDARDFRALAPPLDEDGLPCWDGTPGLSLDGYTRALGDLPAEDLSAEELATRARLSPYSALFERLDREKAEKAEAEP